MNSPALERPELVDELVRRFGSQCVVIGIDTLTRDGDYHVYQYTGDPTRSRAAERRTLDWVREVQDRGAGEIVLNCMNQDGVRKGYDIDAARGSSRDRARAADRVGRRRRARAFLGRVRACARRRRARGERVSYGGDRHPAISNDI